MTKSMRESDLAKETNLVCPVCGKRSVYVLMLDRFMHVDGSANEQCWKALLREGFL